MQGLIFMGKREGREGRVKMKPISATAWLLRGRRTVNASTAPDKYRIRRRRGTESSRNLLGGTKGEARENRNPTLKVNRGERRGINLIYQTILPPPEGRGFDTTITRKKGTEGPGKGAEGIVKKSDFYFSSIKRGCREILEY